MKKHLSSVHFYLYCMFFLLTVSARKHEEPFNRLSVVVMQNTEVAASPPPEWIDDTIAASPDPGGIKDTVAMPPDPNGTDDRVASPPNPEGIDDSVAASPDPGAIDASVAASPVLGEGTSDTLPVALDSAAGKFSTSIRVVSGIASSIALFLFIIGFVFWKRRSRRLQRAKKRAESGAADITIDPESLEYSLREIETATNNFSADNTIGRGGFGSVYKGKLPNGEEIAVKRLSKRSGQGAAEFKNEIAVVAKLQHRNLVRLLGFCLEDEEKILVYEFVPRRSLDYFLFDIEKQGQLNWSMRREIIIGIARGLVYLHEDSRLKIVHRDLKAGNILLDESMHPKIADFGMAKICGIHDSVGNTTRIAGTFGYMAPEYRRRGQYSVKSDVFSFGVVILEIVMGKKNSSFYQSEDSEDLISHVWKQWRDGTPLALLDSTIRESYVTTEVIQCIHIGLLCVEKDANKRPTMASVVYMLNTTSATLPNPSHPAVNGDYILETQPLNLDLELGSIDAGSFTELYPR